MKRPLIIILILAVLAGAAFYVYYFVYNKKHPEYAELEPDFKYEAAEFYNTFTANPDESSKKFNGKMIELSGTPDRIEKVDSLTIAVFVFNEGMFGDEGVRCTFLPEVAGEIENIDNLSGKTIKGYCTGYNDVDVILENCSHNPKNETK